jgi:hypothetical protein
LTQKDRRRQLKTKNPRAFNARGPWLIQAHWN